ncbi:3-hydroxybutyryl-CoA dehydrogenase Hbd [Clostridium aceticum]|uniref:3-hydroxybutyryl-CoA dehydrogenase n=1 Tax=Clostridium aceticum TaxID=84022 RepID=A0A0D8IHL4_9CLOT|nr:3-hydroxyacyl-CoA dehydrogenase NAD-binding domain-containing protein [Clostridium aceticum]AKL93944.1 3-hydroxybutyryl-CoA dehydrogenase Hbd [Clostridium aceticum]KJF28671.1 3-hydroxyacyl-CoA dehydrogenase [Clostridium aceticum]
MEKKVFKNITIFGTGMMGSGIALIFAVKGCFKVTIFSRRGMASGVLETIESSLNTLVEKGIHTKEEVKTALSNVTVVDNMEIAAKDADFIIECIPEDMELKQNLFKDLDQLCRPDTIFATNTSVMSITEIAEKTKNKARVIGTHFWNPPYLIPLVEVIKAEETSEEVVEQTMDLMNIIGKHPIKVNKDVPGFVANRLQHALWREAISIVERGIADAKTVDEALKFGPGLRLPILAPMENADMVGLDLTLSIHSYILKYLEDSHEPSPLLKEKVAKGELGFKTGKGFQEWTPEEATASKKQLAEYLVKVLYNK